MTVRTTTRGHRSAEKIAQAIIDREDFTTSGALRGEARPHRDQYVIWSYDEPIIVIDYVSDVIDGSPRPASATVSEYRHSVTTTKHRGHILLAIAYVQHQTQVVIRYVGGRIFSDGQVR